MDDITVTVRDDKKYVMVEFPESQDFMERDDCYLLAEINNIPGATYIVPVHIYERKVNVRII